MEPANIVLFVAVGFGVGTITTTLFFLLKNRKVKVKDENKKVHIGSDNQNPSSFLPPPAIGESFIELSMDNIVTPIDTTFWKDDHLVEELASSSELVEKYLEKESQGPGGQSNAMHTTEAATKLKETNKNKPVSSVTEKKALTDAKKSVTEKPKNIKQIPQKMHTTQNESKRPLSIQSVSQKSDSSSSSKRETKSKNSGKKGEKKSIIAKSDEEVSDNDDDVPLGLRLNKK